MHKFAPASGNETIVFGAARPGYADEQVRLWIEFMRGQSIQRVCCLLPRSQMAPYSDLLGFYREAFGADRVCWAPLEDFEIADRATLMEKILPFLEAADGDRERVVVHCAGGIGRTGQVLAAWLVRRGFSVEEAIAEVKRMGRNPQEAVVAAILRGRSPWRTARELNALLEDCWSGSENDG
jgi:protein-tyrosine phosphatase